MSLLMDALKKAEEAKRAAGENRTGETPAPAELELAPLDTPRIAPSVDVPAKQTAPASGSPLPELAMHIESVDAELAAVSTDNPARRPAFRPHASPASGAGARTTSATGTASAFGRADTDRAAVRNAFSAKQTSEPRSALWFILPIGCLIAAGIGAYYWWQLQAVSSGSLAIPAPSAANAIAQNRPAPPVAPPAPPVPSNAAQPVAPLAQAPVPAGEPPPATVARPVQSPTAVAATAKPDARASSDTNKGRDPIRSPQTKPAPAVPMPPSADSGNALRLTHNRPVSQPTIEQAYDALQAGHLEAAQRAYQQVLREDPKRTDALLGLATIAARQGNVERAHSYYLLALESDPNDPTAQAGVIQTRGQSDPAQSESRLKTALANQPDSPALLFALGNLYARELRWGEAQQAYFRAYSTEPDNADFIFNLAVSLDQLHQDRLAAQYYQMALNAADASGNPRAAGFDRAQVQKRIQELRP